MPRIELYVDLRGSDPDHADYLEEHVSTLLRGMGLARRTREHAERGEWPGCVGTSTVSEDGTVKRNSVPYTFLSHAMKDGQTLAEFLLANLWREHLLGVFVLQTSNTDEDFCTTNVIYGEARTLSELSEVPTRKAL